MTQLVAQFRKRHTSLDEIEKDEVHNFFERCKLFANTTDYMLDIVNGEQNDSKEKEV